MSRMHQIPVYVDNIKAKVTKESRATLLEIRNDADVYNLTQSKQSGSVVILFVS
jgi:hypothetical protein